VKKSLILLFAIVMLLTSCNIDLSGGRSALLTALMGEEGEKITQMSNDIIDCFTQQDKEALKNLFCEQIRNHPDFDDEIDNAFAYFLCDTYFDSEIDTIASGGDSWEAGERVSWHVSPDIPYVEVSFDGKTRYYSIHSYWYIVNQKDRSLEGLQYIELELLNVDSIKLGEYIG
jgi:hypothetical protein